MTRLDAAALARDIADLKRRLRALEGSTQLQHASVELEDGSTLGVAEGLSAAFTASATAAQALLDAADAAALADGKQTVFYNLTTEPPEGQQFGDLWLQQPGNKLVRWDGAAWVDASDAELAEALAAAQNAQDTADRKINTTRGPTLPAVAEQGDLHYLESTPDLVTGLGGGIIVSMWRWDAGVWVELPLGSMQTPDYSEGSTGVRVDATRAQFQSISATEDVSATTGSFDQLLVDGQDVVELLDVRPMGTVAFGRSYSGIDTAEIGTSRVLTHQLNAGDLQAGRMYRVVVHGHYVGTTSGQAIDAFVVYERFGANPTTTSTVLDGSVIRLTNGSFVGGSFFMECIYLPQDNYENTKFSWCMNRVGGTGTFHVTGTDSNRAFEMWIEDLGVTDATYLSSNNGTLTMRSKEPSTAPPPDPDPVTTYTRTWTATWGRSFDGDGSNRGADAPDLYQGYISGTHGNTRSLFGFDYADIQAKLAGATIKSIAVTYRVKHSWSASAGITVYVSSHDYTAAPASWSASRVNEDRGHWGGQKEGTTYKHGLPVAVGNEFKSGSTRGLGFGPAPSSSPSAYYGYMYGTPKLTITYTK